MWVQGHCEQYALLPSSSRNACYYCAGLQQLSGLTLPCDAAQALKTFGSDVGIAWSGAEDVALVEYAHLTGRPYRVFRQAGWHG
jgi:hypothetical protein